MHARRTGKGVALDELVMAMRLEDEGLTWMIAKGILS
jgi:hypothetical protein